MPSNVQHQYQPQPLDALYSEILADFKGTSAAVAARFAIDMARSSEELCVKRNWLLSIDGLSFEQHDTIYRLTR